MVYKMFIGNIENKPTVYFIWNLSNLLSKWLNPKIKPVVAQNLLLFCIFDFKNNQQEEMESQNINLFLFKMHAIIRTKLDYERTRCIIWKLEEQKQALSAK